MRQAHPAEPVLHRRLVRSRRRAPRGGPAAARPRRAAARPPRGARRSARPAPAPARVRPAGPAVRRSRAARPPAPPAAPGAARAWPPGRGSRGAWCRGSAACATAARRNRDRPSAPYAALRKDRRSPISSDPSGVRSSYRSSGSQTSSPAVGLQTSASKHHFAASCQVRSGAVLTTDSAGRRRPCSSSVGTANTPSRSTSDPGRASPYAVDPTTPDSSTRTTVTTLPPLPPSLPSAPRPTHPVYPSPTRTPG